MGFNGEYVSVQTIFKASKRRVKKYKKCQSNVIITCIIQWLQDGFALRQSILTSVIHFFKTYYNKVCSLFGALMESSFF